MKPMTGYRRGDVVLVGFIFTDESGVKQRPAIVISSYIYSEQRREVIISAVTSQTERLLTGNHLISYWRESGLLFPSVATGIIRTIKQNMIIRKLGTMAETDMDKIDEQLRIALGLLPKNVTNLR